MRIHLLLWGLLSLVVGPGFAQQPVLPGAPQPPQPLPASPESPARLATALPSAIVIGHSEVIGQLYSIETVGGTQFSGTLRASTDQTLTFETKELGLVTVQRASVRQLMSQTPEQARRGFDYVGNGTRMFIAPTARNLYQGEGYVQALNVFLLGVNYGLTDNISLGLLVPVIPFFGVPAIAITPKASVPVSNNFRVGAGVLYGFATGVGGGSGSAGVGYGLATYGSADTNVTFGLGYGFGSDGIGNSPVGVFGANVRVSRLFSVVNETYITSFDGSGGIAGLAGLRYASPRFSGSLGALYYNSRNDSGIYPAYLDVAYRFGKTKLR
ncbi:hypothetical protein GKZ68_16765 [Hymenobacter sp. BRD128]|uniref:hypothetical protein n=1 Tax=Hymenobacter sp. BRD128 TaxID=2675878 RepID=UPI0015654231|nr:hypothetical protein [Hymenobacter sp. BRD128]QKG58132.1 hypothetical protein GKZ68_16765 [Hymenobacter sp. BRD128]